MPPPRHPCLNCGVSSGAPPVKSTISFPLLPVPLLLLLLLAAAAARSIRCTQRSATSWLIISVRLQGREGPSSRGWIRALLVGRTRRLRGECTHAGRSKLSAAGPVCVSALQWVAEHGLGPCTHLGDDSTWQWRQAWLQ